jgi:hypothetical protein
VHREWTNRPELTSPGLTSRSGLTSLLLTSLLLTSLLLTSLLLTSLLLTSPVLVEVQSPPSGAAPLGLEPSWLEPFEQMLGNPWEPLCGALTPWMSNLRPALLPASCASEEHCTEVDAFSRMRDSQASHSLSIARSRHQMPGPFFFSSSSCGTAGPNAGGTGRVAC